MAIKVAGETYESITGQLFEIGRQLRQPNGYPFNPDQLKSFLQLAIEGKFNGVAVAATMPEQIVLSVDYGQSLNQMIAAGNYDWKNDDITAKKFPVVGNGVERLEAKLFEFGSYSSITSQGVVNDIRREDLERPWEPGKIEHVLSFGAKYPEEQRKYPIIGLGSVAKVHGNRLVPYLHRSVAKRDLSLHWWDGGWDGDCRFLAVRKLPLAPQA